MLNVKVEKPNTEAKATFGLAKKLYFFIFRIGMYRETKKNVLT